MEQLKICVLGAAGRMGRLLLAKLADDPALLPIAIGRDGDARAGMAQAAAVIDFTTPSASVHHAQIAAELAKPLVIGTTGLDGAQMQILRDASKRTAIFYARNFSLGIHVLRQLVTRAARDLPPEYQIEIVEAHHTHKKDAPSGTGLALAEAAVRAGITPPIHALRLGGIIGDHTVHFANAQEVVTLEHRAIDRAVFAMGALRAARWVITQPPGFYGMDDLIQA